MSRYIDADALIDAHYEYMNEHSYEWDAILFSWSESLMKNAPSIDIVHCGECKYWYDEYDDSACMLHPDFTVNADDFCSYGSRSEKPNKSTCSKMEQVGKE